MRKMVDQPKTTQKELANDLKAPGTTVTVYTIGNAETLQRLHVPPAKEGTRTDPP